MTSSPITKSLIVAHRQCALRAWMTAHTPDLAVTTDAAQVRMEQGAQVARVARSHFADATFAQVSTCVEADAMATANADRSTPLLGAAFSASVPGASLRVATRVGAFQNECATSVCSVSELKQHHIEDAAIDVAVMVWAGRAPKSFSIVHPDGTLALTDNSTNAMASLLRQDDVSEQARALVPKVAEWARDCADTIRGARPFVTAGAQCSDPVACPFAGVCGKPAKSTDDANRLPSKAKAVGELVAAGVTRVSAMPVDAMTHDRNLLVWEAIVFERAVLRPSLRDAIRALPFPRMFLDFEGVATALPRFPGVRPHQTIGFQWSCHRQEQPGAKLAHAGYLETCGDDPREAFARSLLAFVGTDGPIVVYSPYEATVLKHLAEHLPHLRDALLAVIGRLFDLLPLARRGYYAPAMAHSWSIKSLLPTVSGGFSYDSLDQSVEDGDAAQAAYLRMIDPQTPAATRARLQSELESYCPTDTLALWIVVEAFCTMETFAPTWQPAPKVKKGKKKGAAADQTQEVAV